MLQTIGLAIIAMAPALWLLQYRAGPAALLVLAVAGYVSFVLAFPHLEAFVGRHPMVGLVLLYDFPPWPWLSLVLIGRKVKPDSEEARWLDNAKHAAEEIRDIVKRMNRITSIEEVPSAGPLARICSTTCRA